MKKVFTVISICVCSVLIICAVGLGVFVYQNRHTVKFHTNGAQKLESKNCLVLLNTPEVTRKGYSFAGWYFDDMFTQRADLPMFLNENIDLYANWVKNKYLVKFVANGGISVTPMNVGFIDESPRTVRNGYLLEGWYYEPELVTRAVFPLEVNEPITLYANWKKSHKVTFVRNGGNGMSEMVACEINESPDTYRQGYRFKGWYFDSKFEEKVEFPLNLTEDVTLYAWWEEIVYLVNFETNGGSSIATREVGKIETAPVTYRDGYTFLGWYKDAAFKTKVTFPLKISENITLYARWEKTAYYVNFVTNGGSSVSSVYTNNLTYFPSTSRTNYVLEGWYLDKALTKAATIPMNIDSTTTLYAKWLLVESSIGFSDFKIKYMDSSLYSAMTCWITPSEFDLISLAERGYNITITVSYNVHYVKDFDGILDIGYLGSPKYEVELYVSGKLTKSQNDLGTSTSSDKRTIRYTTTAHNLIGESVKVTFSTDNIQNEVHIEDIVVTYKCTK